MITTDMHFREAWLMKRRSGIGASEAAAVLGISKWMSSERLWEIKTGKAEADDLSSSPIVQYGVQCEPHIRELFKLDYPGYDVSHEEYKIIRNPEYPFIFATLDGEIRHDNKHGVLEIKTVQPRNRIVWEDWNERVPQQYFVQILHQLLATGYEFAILRAYLKRSKGGASIRDYKFERTNYHKEIEYLKNELAKFWGYIERDERPPLKLPPL